MFVALATLFATIGPLDVAIVFASLTTNNTLEERRAFAVKGTVVGGSILLAFAVFGDSVLELFGISLPALRIGGGILLLLIAIDMVFARPSGGTSTTPDENSEAAEKTDISIFPLATPLVAGPGAMGAVVLLMADAAGNPAGIALVIGALIAILGATFICLILTSQLQRLLGKTGVHVISRVFGVILAALAVQFMLDGLVGSEIFNATG